MSINWVMLSSNDGFTNLAGETRIGNYPPRVGFALQSLNKYPSREPFSVSSNSGRVYLTNRRIVYLPDSSTPQLQSFAVPLLNLHDSRVTAPFFGPNVCMGIVQPVPNGGIPSRHAALELKLTFKDGGAFDFHTDFVRIRERMQQAVDVARENQGNTVGSGSGVSGVNMDAVHLDELPAYEERGMTSTTTQRPSEETPPHSEPPSAARSASVGASNPPAEPPPGYEEVQRDSIAESLDRDLRLRNE